MRCACVDIGSNTTRVLVADVGADGVREVTCEKAYTRLGGLLLRSGTLPEDALDSLADVVALQVAVARALGAERLRVVATAAIRAASNADALRDAVRARAGVEVDVLEGTEEARLAFLGATHKGVRSRHRTDVTCRDPTPLGIAVVDVGGGSTELAVGTLDGGVEWSVSVPVGSSLLADAHLRSDPPTAAEMAALRADAELLLSGARPPRADVGLAVGGSATSMARLLPGAVDAGAVAGALALLTTAPSATVARRHGLDPERVRLLPAGLTLLGTVAERLGCPLRVGDGGLREGVCLELTFTSAG